jgi:alpha/beta superfamily hydrolase
VISKDAEPLDSPGLEPGEQHVFFMGDHTLEGKFGWPPRPARWNMMLPEQIIRGGVVVCHPYPPAGAAMDLPLVYRVAKACRQRQLASLRFNFRSVGGSLGDFSGSEEYRDVLAALSFMKKQLDPEDRVKWYKLPLGLAGWSFGSVMAARAAGQAPELQALALVGFPVHWEHMPPDTLDRLRRFHGPLLAVCAENDHHGTPEQVAKVLSDVGLRPTVEIVPGADHYLGGSERLVAGLVADFFAKALSPQGR